MSSDGLDKYKGIWELKKIAEEETPSKLSDLERVFLSFSEHTKGGELVVKRPKLFQLGERQKSHLGDALSHMGITPQKLPDHIDITGAFDLTTLGSDQLVFVSPLQFMQEHHSGMRSYLNPLIEEVFSKAAFLLRDFTIHEAVYGQVNMKRDGLSLKDLRFFPERFSKGPYHMTVLLDTPISTIKDFSRLYCSFDGFNFDPKSALLDKKRVDSAVSRSIRLRERLGALSRYEVPDTFEFSVKTNYCMVREPQTTLVYIYSEKFNENMMVYFGKQPYDSNIAPEVLTVLNGEEHQNTLATLVEKGILEVSEKVLDERLTTLKESYDEVIKTLGAESKETYAPIEHLIGGLEDAKKYFKQIINPEMRSEYVSKIMPEIFEFMLYPPNNEPILYELLPRLSWNGIIRGYHRVHQFTSTFSSASDKGKGDIVKKISKSLFFSHYQNHAVNNWLYDNHREICEKEGVSFDIVR